MYNLMVPNILLYLVYHMFHQDIYVHILVFNYQHIEMEMMDIFQHIYVQMDHHSIMHQLDIYLHMFVYNYQHMYLQDMSIHTFQQNYLPMYPHQQNNSIHMFLYLIVHIDQDLMDISPHNLQQNYQQTVNQNIQAYIPSIQHLYTYHQILQDNQ